MGNVSINVNEFITTIYSSITDADKWTEILDQTASMAGAKAANICLVDYLSQELNSQFMCKETAHFYPTYINSPHMEVELKAVARLPQVQTTKAFYETGEFVLNANKVFNNDPMDLTESEDWLFENWSVRTRYITRLNIQPSYLDLHTLLFEEKPTSKRLEGVSKIDTLTPHFAKAVELSRPFLLLKARFKATLDVLDRFHLGVFILSDTGSVVLKNTAADRMLDLSDAISIDMHGRLSSRTAVDSPSIDKLVAEILFKQRSGEYRNSTELLLKRRSQKNPYLLEITPLSDTSVIGQLSGLMILMIDPDYHKIISSRGMEQMFGLSKAENHICQLLMDGLSTGEIAESRNVSPITVKNQIKSLLSKTGNRNRSDLIRQALTINLPVDVPQDLSDNGVN